MGWLDRFPLGVLAVVAAWLAVAAFMQAPRHLSSLLVNVEGIGAAQSEALGQRLLAVPGVAEAVVVAEDGVAYLKVDRQLLDRERLKLAFASLGG